jgi:exodeoxyribonuclease VII large subunit
MSATQAYSVGGLTRYIKQRLEGDPVLQDVWVTGEVSNLTQHASGHVYFTLKDEEAQLSCAMFKGVAIRYLRKMPKHGAKIEVRGELSLYPPRGSYQLIVRDMQLAGEGDLHQRFLALRDKLQAEGLFDAERKKPIPRFPRTIGVVTSPTGAVIRDIVDTLRRRYPHVNVVLAPTVVQGDAGADSIVRSLATLNAIPGIDVILLARGGGSLEDLWCFNEERVARAIVASEVPVISGVGHETDTTIADFVADLRAATPTAAAEQAVPLAFDLRASLSQIEQQMGRSLQHFIEVRQQMLDDYQRQMEATLLHQLSSARQQTEHLEGQLRSTILGTISLKRQTMDEMAHRLESAATGLIDKQRNALQMMELQLKSFDFRDVLSRGFSITTLAGKPVLDAASLAEQDEITTYYHQGKSVSSVKKTEDYHGGE